MDESLGSFTIHGGNISVGGRDFMFYHNGLAPNGSGFRRSAAIEEFKWKGDSIPFIPQTEAGVTTPLKNLNPFERVEAETMADSWGIKTDRMRGSEHKVTSIHNGDWTRLRSVDFGEGASEIEVCVPKLIIPGTIRFIVDGVEAPLASVDIENEGLTKCKVNPSVNGIHDMMILFTGPDGELFEFDWWKLR